MRFVVSFIACLAALVAVRFATPSERNAATSSALLFFLGWALFAASWLPYSHHWFLNAPAQIIWLATGVKVKPEHLWAAIDAVSGFYIFTKAHDRAWGIALFVLFLVQVVIHMSHEVGGLPYSWYLMMLDATFYCEAACFLAIGGDGIAEYVSTMLDRWNARGRVRVGKVHSVRSAEAFEANRQELSRVDDSALQDFSS